MCFEEIVLNIEHSGMKISVDLVNQIKEFWAICVRVWNCYQNAIYIFGKMRKIRTNISPLSNPHVFCWIDYADFPRQLLGIFFSFSLNAVAPLIWFTKSTKIFIPECSIMSTISPKHTEKGQPLLILFIYVKTARANLRPYSKKITQ